MFAIAAVAVVAVGDAGRTLKRMRSERYLRQIDERLGGRAALEIKCLSTAHCDNLRRGRAPFRRAATHRCLRSSRHRHRPPILGTESGIAAGDGRVFGAFVSELKEAGHVEGLRAAGVRAPRRSAVGWAVRGGAQGGERDAADGVLDGLPLGGTRARDLRRRQHATTSRRQSSPANTARPAARAAPCRPPPVEAFRRRPRAWGVRASGSPT